MKKIFLLLLCIAVLFCAVSCKDNNGAGSGTGGSDTESGNGNERDGVSVFVWDGEKYAIPKTELMKFSSNAWAPGDVEVKYLFIKNDDDKPTKIDLMLHFDEIEKTMSDVLYYQLFVGVSAGSIARDDINDEQEICVGAFSVTEDGIIIEKGGTLYVALAVYMTETAGNEYSGGEVDMFVGIIVSDPSEEEKAPGGDGTSGGDVDDDKEDDGKEDDGSITFPPVDLH